MAFIFFLSVNFTEEIYSQENVKTFLKVLGTVQDGGAPHIGCKKTCCINLSPKEKENRKVTALEVFQPEIRQSILFEATPDIIHQWNSMNYIPKIIFLTHAHIGHYSGLLHLGREALGAKKISVYAMPKMKKFLKKNAPWSQLVSLKNIILKNLENKIEIEPIESIKVKPIKVPHRDEFSETVGFIITGPKKKILFLPDIDKWSLWKEDLIRLLNEVDLAFLDGTFFDAKEVNYRPISEIPHPFVKETVEYLDSESFALKNKIYFIHLNHTNPLLSKKSEASRWIRIKGFNVARIGDEFEL